MGRVVVITSGKGGVGKTTVTANVGASLAKLGKKVVVVDMDIGLRNLDVVMGLENRVVYNIMDIIEGRCKISQALVREKHLSNFFLLPASQMHTKEDVKIEAVDEIISIIKESFDYVLLDSPAGIENGFRSASSPANEALIVVTPDVSSVRDADRVIGLLENNGIEGIALVINRYDPNLVRKKKMLDSDDIVDVLSLDLIGIIPEDKAIIDSENRGEVLSIVEKTKAVQAFSNIARRMEGENVPFIDLEPEKKGLFGIFRRK